MIILLPGDGWSKCVHRNQRAVPAAPECGIGMRQCERNHTHTAHAPAHAHKQHAAYESTLSTAARVHRASSSAARSPSTAGRTCPMATQSHSGTPAAAPAVPPAAPPLASKMAVRAAGRGLALSSSSASDTASKPGRVENPAGGDGKGSSRVSAPLLERGPSWGIGAALTTDV